MGFRVQGLGFRVWGSGFRVITVQLGRPFGYFIFPLIGLKRTLSTISEALKGQPVFLGSPVVLGFIVVGV